MPRGGQLPTRTVTVEELRIDHTNVADYAAVTGLRYGNTVPLTYPFALTFPSVMSLVTGFDFPFAAMGSVHTENHITRYRPIAVTDTVGVRVHAENLREHRKGLLVDLVTAISVGNELAWQQVTTFLHQQRTSLSGEPKPPPQKQPRLPRRPLCCGSRRAEFAAMPPSAEITTPSIPVRSRRGCSASPPSSHTECLAPQRFWRMSKPAAGRGAVFGAVRQAGAAAGQRRRLRRRSR
ncbi:metal-binding domain of MaoC dehydratase family protein [Mycobacterium kansasii]|uniref:Metal-binding domain of MaoC dehydratase family protein n=1 Tax=Mycobacterium kansasii TaxID=1768 RepID=A0A1V3WQ51_MYCKA|nr:metal-binding domain of MaoC dehydratase family protein [Mycobacterium kansasii]